MCRTGSRKHLRVKSSTTLRRVRTLGISNATLMMIMFATSARLYAHPSPPPELLAIDAKTQAPPSPPLTSPPKVDSLPVAKQPADSLNGPPFVTARSWAIADRRTGQVLFGHDEAKPVDIASTTKIMTAFVVLRLAAKTPAVLDETVTFSHRADQTIGSTSGIKEGERLSVRELLYGLLLPSGNDAAVAVAEHFGADGTNHARRRQS